MTLDEELRLDEAENRREAAFIRQQLPAEVKARLSESVLLYFIDAIVDYYYDSGILESQADEVEIDLEQVAEAVCGQAKADGVGEFSPADVFFVVQADLDFQEQNL